MGGHAWLAVGQVAGQHLHSRFCCKEKGCLPSPITCGAASAGVPLPLQKAQPACCLQPALDAVSSLPPGEAGHDWQQCQYRRPQPAPLAGPQRAAAQLVALRHMRPLPGPLGRSAVGSRRSSQLRRRGAACESGATPSPPLQHAVRWPSRQYAAPLLLRVGSPAALCGRLCASFSCVLPAGPPAGPTGSCGAVTALSAMAGRS